MKPKALRKKLSLKKETVADLNRSLMKNVYGRGDVTQPEETVVIDCTEMCPTAVGCPTECTCGPTGNIACPCGSNIGPE